MTAPSGRPPGGDTVPRWAPGPDDWVVDAIPPHPRTRDGRRRRRALLLVAAVLALLATVAGVLVHRSVTAGTDTPQEAVELFLAAGQRQDWPASWELICESERAAVGSFDRWVDLQEMVMSAEDPDAEPLPFTVGRARPVPDSRPQAHLEEYYVPEDSGMFPLTLYVAAEGDRFTVCSPPGSGA